MWAQFLTVPIRVAWSVFVHDSFSAEIQHFILLGCWTVGLLGAVRCVSSSAPAHPQPGSGSDRRFGHARRYTSPSLSSPFGIVPKENAGQGGVVPLMAGSQKSVTGTRRQLLRVGACRAIELGSAGTVLDKARYLLNRRRH